MNIPCPTIQAIKGDKKGGFQQYNVKQKPLTVRSYRELTLMKEFSTTQNYTDEELDAIFLNTIHDNPTAVYGSSVEATLFNDTVKSWYTLINDICVNYFKFYCYVMYLGTLVDLAPSWTMSHMTTRSRKVASTPCGSTLECGIRSSLGTQRIWTSIVSIIIILVLPK